MKRFFRTKSRDHMLADLATGHQLHRALGLIVYACYGHTHSRLHGLHKRPDAG